MLDPKSLKVGDQVRFVSIPDEWSAPAYVVPREDLTFYKKMIERRWPSRVYQLDYLGYPWIRAITHARGNAVYHSWMIAESTGWRRVNRRQTSE
jgi:hypothetical protein